MECELWLLWASLLAVPLVYYLAALRRRAGTARRPPGPRPLPVLGNLLDLRGNFHHTLARLARTHGPVMSIGLGLTTAVVVSSQEAAREAFANHDKHLAAHFVPDAIRVLGYPERSTLWLPSSAPLWKTLRNIMATHIFSPRSLAASREIRERKVRDLVSYFHRRAGQEVEVGLAMYGGALNLLSSSFFSADLVDVGTKSALGLQGLLEEIIHLLMKPNVSDLFPFLRPLDLHGCRRLSARLFEQVFRTLDGIIDRRLSLSGATSSTDRQRDFLDALLDLMSAGKISRDNLKPILFDVLLAGGETTSTTVVWAMAELLRNPSIMARVCAEIKDTLGGKETVEETDVESLPYLQAVVKEAMRLHHMAPLLLPRQAIEDGVEIAGYAVPKGCRVIFNLWAMMRDPEVWERPDEFVPERFMDPAAAAMDFRGKNFKFIPFGSGRRQCPGLPMAEHLVPFILASLLHEFEWRLPDGISAEQLDLSEKFCSANHMAVPLKAIPVVIT